MADIGLIAKAVAEIAKVVGNWQVSKDRNRLLYRIEAAMKYVFVKEKTGEFKDIDDKKQEKLLLHFRKRVFDEN